jgi:hypothetical protein
MLDMTGRDIYDLPNCQMTGLRGARPYDVFAEGRVASNICSFTSTTRRRHSTRAELCTRQATGDARSVADPALSAMLPLGRRGAFPVVHLHVLPACMLNAMPCCHVSYTIISPEQRLRTWRRLCHLVSLPESAFCQEPCTAMSVQRHQISCSRYPP